MNEKLRLKHKMMTNKHMPIFLSLVFVCNMLFAQKDTASWQKLSVPVFSDFKKIQFVSKDTALVIGKQLVILEGDTCKLFSKQIPDIIDLSFVLNSKAIYATTSTTYQNSNLYFWDGMDWKPIDNPLANTIYGLFFVDKNNGLLVSYGEVVQVKNGNWQQLSPPTNRSLSACVQTGDTLLVLSLEKGLFSYEQNSWKPVKNSKNTHHVSLLNKTVYTLGTDFLGIVKSDSLIKLSENSRWKDIQSITQTTDGTIIGVGKQGTIIRFKDGIIKQDSVPVKQDLAYIVSHNSSLWSVGKEGTLLNYTNKELRRTSKVWKGFEKITFKQEAKVIDDEYGVVVADFNKDGWPDIFTCGLFEQERLYINQKNGSFIEKTQEYKLSNNQIKNTKELNLGA